VQDQPALWTPIVKVTAMNLGKFKHQILCAIVAMFAVSQSVLAQCAMCRAGLDGDPQAAAASHQMDIAVMMLLTPPVLIFVGFFVLVYRFRNHFKSSNGNPADLDQVAH